MIDKIFQSFTQKLYEWFEVFLAKTETTKRLSVLHYLKLHQLPAAAALQ